MYGIKNILYRLEQLTNSDNSKSKISPPLLKGRARVGVETLIVHHFTPIIAFPLQREETNRL
jgi:hypothetical protein